MYAFPPSMWFWLAPLLVWSAIWKGIALWKAARNGHRVWYIILFVVNTAGILEIIYVLAFSKKSDTPASPVKTT